MSASPLERLQGLADKQRRGMRAALCCDTCSDKLAKAHQSEAGVVLDDLQARLSFGSS